MASSRQATAPTSRRMGLGAGAFFRLPAAREPDAVLPVPEAVRFPPAFFFCAVAIENQILSRVFCIGFLSLEQHHLHDARYQAAQANRPAVVSKLAEFPLIGQALNKPDGKVPHHSGHRYAH